MEILVENIWVSEIQTPKIWDTQNRKLRKRPKYGNSKLRKNIWVSEIRTPKIPGHRKARQNKLFGFLNFGKAASHEIYIWCKTR